MLRTHTCGELSEKSVNKEVTLCGWVHTRRDHGKLIFIDLRDRYGLTQVIFAGKAIHSVAEKLRPEDVILVKGKVALRPKGNQNPKLPTGKIELGAVELKILSASETPPFEVTDETNASEEVRLSHRFLDLRRPPMLNNLITRYKVTKATRDYLDKEGLLEIETPFLTKSTPEGARDYLVPSRLNPGKFYALPQSPQLFKQILMISGVDKYFQIARCFRDEDLRADRQPEFTQLDIELSFVTEEDIYTLCEGLMKHIFKTVLGKDIKTPFPRMSHKEAMDKYKTDKPDTGEGKEGYHFLWVSDFPLLKYNDEEKRWGAEHHPFTSPDTDNPDELDKDPGKIKARAYDLVLNGVEIASGSIRIHDSRMQEKVFDLIGMGKEEARNRFGFLLKAFQFGVPPHGGIAFGLDRLATIFTKSSSIRDVIAFPKTQKAVCPLTDAPSSVSEKQLKELGLKTR